MKNLRRAYMLFMAVLLAASLCACGNSGPGGTPPEMPDGNSGPGGTPLERPDGNGGPGGTPPERPDGNGGPGGAPGGNSPEIDYSGAVEISSRDTQSGQVYTSTASDESALLISTSDDSSLTMELTNGTALEGTK